MGLETGAACIGAFEWPLSAGTTSSRVDSLACQASDMEPRRDAAATGPAIAPSCPAHSPVLPERATAP
jgi:hypothetical protein